MLIRKNFDNRILFMIGTSLVALRSVLQWMIDRRIGADGGTDFAMGVLQGVGLGCLLLFVWRSAHQRRLNG